MIDDNGFRDRMPSRTYIRDIMLPKLYNELKKGS